MPKRIDDAQIYRDVMQAVIERGYDGTTTKQMAESAGISEVTLFRKYGNKAQLVRQAMIALAERIDFVEAARYTGDVSADLLRVVTLYQESAEQEGRFFYTMMLELPRHPELMDSLNRPITLVSTVGQLLARYQAEGVLKPQHPLHALASLIGPLIANNMLRAAFKEMPMPPLNLESHVVNFIDGHRI